MADEFISDEKFACNNDQVRIVGKDGDVTVGRHQTSAAIPVRGGTINWYCGNADETWDAPSGTEYIVVTRGETAGKVSYYGKK